MNGFDGYFACASPSTGSVRGLLCRCRYVCARLPLCLFAGLVVVTLLDGEEEVVAVNLVTQASPAPTLNTDEATGPRTSFATATRRESRDKGLGF